MVAVGVAVVVAVAVVVGVAVGVGVAVVVVVAVGVAVVVVVVVVVGVAVGVAVGVGVGVGVSAASRRKGVSGEREVAAIYGAAGATVRGLEGGGDHVIHMVGKVRHSTEQRILHSEVKRYGERAKFPEWIAQTMSEAPPGTVPVLHTRADHGEWLVTLRLADFVEVIR